MYSFSWWHAVAASVFGEQRRLQPMAPEQKARWTKEIDWLLSVADFIVEFVPSRQVAEDGSTMEVRNESPTLIFITHGWLCCFGGPTKKNKFVIIMQVMTISIA